MKSCPFTGQECSTTKCAGWGTLSEDGSEKSCLVIAGCIASIVQANKTLRENRMPMPVDDAYDEDDDDELPSSRPRRF